MSAEDAPRAAAVVAAVESDPGMRISFNERLGQQRAKGRREDDALRREVALDVWKRWRGNEPPPSSSSGTDAAGGAP